MFRITYQCENSACAAQDTKEYKDLSEVFPDDKADGLIALPNQWHLEENPVDPNVPPILLCFKCELGPPAPTFKTRAQPMPSRPIGNPDGIF